MGNSNAGEIKKTKEDYFKDKFGKLPEALQEEIFDYAQVHGAYKTSQRYAKKAGMHADALYKRLRKELKKMGVIKKNEKGNKKDEYVQLTPEEKRFLASLKKGNIDLEEASRIVAIKVFEKMLKNPNSANFVDFFRTELLKLKKQEIEDKNTWAMELINRMFGGKLPPRICPNCGAELVSLPKQTKDLHALEEGVVVHDKPIPATRDS